MQCFMLNTRTMRRGNEKKVTGKEKNDKKCQLSNQQYCTKCSEYVHKNIHSYFCAVKSNVIYTKTWQIKPEILITEIKKHEGQFAKVEAHNSSKPNSTP